MIDFLQNLNKLSGKKTKIINKSKEKASLRVRSWRKAMIISLKSNDKNELPIFFEK